METQNLLKEAFDIETSLDWLNSHPEEWDGYTLAMTVNDEIIPVESIKIRDKINDPDWLKIFLYVSKTPFYNPKNTPRLETLINEVIEGDNSAKLNLVYAADEGTDPPKICRNVQFSECGIRCYTIKENSVMVGFINSVSKVKNLTALGSLLRDNESPRYVRY